MKRVRRRPFKPLTPKPCVHPGPREIRDHADFRLTLHRDVVKDVRCLVCGRVLFEVTRGQLLDRDKAATVVAELKRWVYG